MNVNTTRPFALFENQSLSQGVFPFEFYSDPVQEIQTRHSAEVGGCLQKIQTLSTQGYFLVGYLAYEAFDKNSPPSDDPLIYFCAFRERHSLTRQEFEKNVLPQLTDFHSPLVVSNFKVNETFTSYKNKLLQIKEHQRQGETYQVNFTMKSRFHWQGEPFQFFLELKKYQKVSMAAFFHFDRDICSYSPELFIRKDHNIITAKPMKGTAPRGQNRAADELIISQMQSDKKTMSENLMIVDLIRNDLGQVALPGTVKVPHLFEVETFATLHQMTSTVQAHVDPGIDFETLLHALFPCGSITGAPKKSTMKIIRDLEGEPRGLYTGAIGYILPSGDFVFNVAIRTLIFRHSDTSLKSGLRSGLKIGEMGLGSGIVFGSDIKKEWDECLLKGKFVGLINSRYQLIESFRFQTSTRTFLRLDLHLDRISESAATLGFTCPIEKIKNDLLKLKELLLNNSADQKIRLLLSQSGEYTLTYHPLEPTPQEYQVLCCQKPIQKQSLLQQHKTTERSFYDECFAKAVALGYDEILFFNQDGNCVEGSRHNLIIKTDQGLITPPISDGALPGVFRQSLFQDPSVSIHEQSFDWTELIGATEVYLCNSVRGMVRAKISPTRMSL